MTYVQPAVLSRLERLELRARRVVEGWLVGRQRSPYLGTATEFASHRAYATGDEMRHLDWKVYARTKRLVVKQFQEATTRVTTAAKAEVEAFVTGVVRAAGLQSIAEGRLPSLLPSGEKKDGA